MAKNIDIGGRLHSTATGNIVTGANEVYDDNKGKKQSEINTEIHNYVENINNALGNLNPEQQEALGVAEKTNNNEAKLGYYVCDTEGNLAEKVISDATSYILSKGGNIKVKMTNANIADNATLNINSTGAKPLYYSMERASSSNSWEAGETVEVYYDGINFYANNVASGNDDVFDVSAKTGQSYETLNAALTAADSVIPVSKKKGGMSIKFIKFTPASYSVVRTDGLTEQPIGSELHIFSSVVSGTYNAGQLNDFTTLPNTTGVASAITYYVVVRQVVEESHITTYTSWVIIKATNDIQEYVQCILRSATWNIIASNWQGVDNEPTVGSDNLVKSGGIKKELILGAIYDISAKNPTAGPNNDGKFESLSALLLDVNLNALIPTSVRRGGMSIKFVQSSDNKYVQYRLMSDQWSTTPSDWQGVDEEPTNGSDNLVKSRGVYEDLQMRDNSLNNTILFTSKNGVNVVDSVGGAGIKWFNIPTKSGVEYTIVPSSGSATGYSVSTWLDKDTIVYDVPVTIYQNSVSFTPNGDAMLIRTYQASAGSIAFSLIETKALESRVDREEEISKRLQYDVSKIDGAKIYWEIGSLGNNYYEETPSLLKNRVRSSFVFLPKGFGIRVADNQIIKYVNKETSYVAVNKTSYFAFNDEVVRLLVEYANAAEITDVDTFSSTIIKVPIIDEYDKNNWELGYIGKNGGAEYPSTTRKRSINIFKAKAGDVIVPYVFSHYQICVYNGNGNFVKRLPEDVSDEVEGGQLNDGWFTSNSFEFKEDMFVKLVVEYTSNANFTGNNNTPYTLTSKLRYIHKEYTLPQYIKNVINEKSKNVLADDTLANPFVFTFITDMHEYFYHIKAAAYCAELSSRFLINGGDLHSLPVDTIDEVVASVRRNLYEMKQCNTDIIACRGNHESMNGTDYTTEMWYNQVQKPLRKKDYIYNPLEPEGEYFYVDDDVYKIRVICLDTYHCDSGSRTLGMLQTKYSVSDRKRQRIWLQNVALDLSSKGTDESEWTVIVVSHAHIIEDLDEGEMRIYPESRALAETLSAVYEKRVTNYQNMSSNYGDTSVDWSNIDYSNVKYSFAGYFCGHVHFDSINKSLGFPHVTTTCAHPLENADHYVRTFDTPTEYAFDLISIDTPNKKVKLKRIGVGEDREYVY